MSQGSGEGESLGILVMQQHQAVGMGDVSGLWGRRIPQDPGYAAASAAGAGRGHSRESVRGAEGVVCAWPLLPAGARTSPKFLCVLLLAPPNLLLFSSSGLTRAFEEKLQFPSPWAKANKTPELKLQKKKQNSKKLKVVSFPTPPKWAGDGPGCHPHRGGGIKELQGCDRQDPKNILCIPK